jgi:hypothetical protein
MTMLEMYIAARSYAEEQAGESQEIAERFAAWLEEEAREEPEYVAARSIAELWRMWEAAFLTEEVKRFYDSCGARVNQTVRQRRQP